MAAAFPYMSEDFKFDASIPWLNNFKQKHRIRQRKITKFVSAKECVEMEDVVKAAEKFQIQTRAAISHFHLDYVINTDQTGCQYDSTYNRTLEHKGAKTVFCKKKEFK